VRTAAVEGTTPTIVGALADAATAGDIVTTGVAKANTVTTETSRGSLNLMAEKITGSTRVISEID